MGGSGTLWTLLFAFEATYRRLGPPMNLEERTCELNPYRLSLHCLLFPS